MGCGKLDQRVRSDSDNPCLLFQPDRVVGVMTNVKRFQESGVTVQYVSGPLAQRRRREAGNEACDIDLSEAEHCLCSLDNMSPPSKKTDPPRGRSLCCQERY
jgi:hypothetical protein